MSDYAYRTLRSYVFKSSLRAPTAAYARIFSTRSKVQRLVPNINSSNTHHLLKTTDYQKRVLKLQSIDGIQSYYPRTKKPSNDVERVSPSSRTFHDDFTVIYGGLQNGETERDKLVEVNGRVLSARRSSSKLTFVTICYAGGSQIQGVCDVNKIDLSSGSDRHLLEKFSKCVRRGDWISITGHPHRTDRGELSILATKSPTIVAPSLNQVPDKLEDEETLARHRHVDLALNKKARDIIQLRHTIENTLQDFLNARGFLKVNTPILNAGAGGAVARPFRTIATELSDTTLDLRIAPELFLKRLIVGGLPAVYELGTAFRNEGVDATHNPEFTICEFYQVFTNLDDLMQLTQQLFQALDQNARSMRESEDWSLEPFSTFTSDFEQLEFIPFLESKIREHLKDSSFVFPDLSEPRAKDELKQLFRRLGIPESARASLPKMLDVLAGRFIEPHCKEATFIKFHPSIMSPLAKSFICPRTKQVVSARAELFISGIEYANMYEEENSPFEQRLKFKEQLYMRGDDGETSAEVDESYIEALEWGMPPTGGWGCGVDRIVMLFAGTTRIADVLPFGTLRNVVAMAQNGRTASGRSRIK